MSVVKYVAPTQNSTATTTNATTGNSGNSTGSAQIGTSDNAAGQDNVIILGGGTSEGNDGRSMAPVE